MSQKIDRSLLSRFLAEFVGTFCLVLFGPGAAIVFSNGGVAGYVMIALVFGGVVAGVCTLIGPISGGHINPAVTLAAALRREISWLEALWYVGTQIVGATVAAVVLGLAMPGSWRAGATQLAEGVHPIGGMMLESALTGTLILAVILAPARWKSIAAGLAVCLGALVGGAATGASMNPARTLGPFLAGAGGGDHVWVYLVGPLLGAVVGVLIAKMWERDVSKVGMDQRA